MMIRTETRWRWGGGLSAGALWGGMGGERETGRGLGGWRCELLNRAREQHHTTTVVSKSRQKERTNMNRGSAFPSFLLSFLPFFLPSLLVGFAWFYKTVLYSTHVGYSN